jgi:hypothetical protein
VRSAKTEEKRRVAEKGGDTESDEKDAEDYAGAEIELDERADEMKAEEKDECSGDGSEKGAVLAKKGTDGAGRCAERNEDNGKTGDKSESRSKEARARQLPSAELFHADAREHGNVAGNQRQNARREKRNQPGEKSPCKRNIGHMRIIPSLERIP